MKNGKNNGIGHTIAQRISEDMIAYSGLWGEPGGMVMAYRKAHPNPTDKRVNASMEFLTGPTVDEVSKALDRRLQELSKDPLVVRVIASIVTSEARREEPKNKIIIPKRL